MGRKTKRSSSSIDLDALDEQCLRRDIEYAANGGTNELIVDLIRTVLPLSYASSDRKYLIERVARIYPLRCRKGDIVSDSSDSSSEELHESESDDDRRETSENGDSGRRVEKWSNGPMFSDLGGVSSVIEILKMEVVVPLHQLKLLRHLAVEPKSRILLHGPPGCGKTTLARAIGNEARLPFREISAAALVSGVSGINIRGLFSTAYKEALCIVLIDEIDAMTSNTESLQKEVVRRAVNQIMACMDELYRFNKHNVDSKTSNSRLRYVLVIGATNMPDALDPALRRRFDHEIVMGVPDEDERLDILSVLTRDLKVEVGFDLPKIARCTLGFVGGDLVALVKEAGILAVNRITRNSDPYIVQRNRQPCSDEEMKNLTIKLTDFVEAGMMVQPSSKIEGFSTTPIAKWDDVGGHQLVKSEFERHIIKRIKFPEVYMDLGMNLATAFFLFGPSGCGKTLIVEALANEAGTKLIHIKGHELVKDYGDQSGLVVQKIFNQARTCSPCILFFDEVEAITLCCDKEPLPVYRQFLMELNGAKQSSDVYVIAATDRRQVMSHSSLMEKFDELMSVSLPSPEERGAILKALARNKPIDANVELMSLGKGAACENFTGADLSALMKGAAKAAIDRPMRSDGGCSVPWTINDADFKIAVERISPCVLSTVLLVCYYVVSLLTRFVALRLCVFGCSNSRSESFSLRTVNEAAWECFECEKIFGGVQCCDGVVMNN